MSHAGWMHSPEADEVLAFLEDGQDFLVTSHVNSDPDGTGGCLATQGLLSGLGKRSTVVLPGEPDPRSRFLSGFGAIRRSSDGAPGTGTDRAIVLDCSDLDRTGPVKEHIGSDVRVLNIDHHGDNTRFGHLNLISTEVSSTCELVYDLAVAAGMGIDRLTAEQIYSGILYDTGGFRYASTSPRTLEVASHLLKTGVAGDVVADRIFHTRSLEAIKVTGRAIASLELALDGRVATLTVEPEDADELDHEATVDVGLEVAGVLASVLFVEERAGEFRVSLRSRGGVDVKRVASALGGGGHARAAGCSAKGTIEEIRASLLGEIEKALA